MVQTPAFFHTCMNTYTHTHTRTPRCTHACTHIHAHMLALWCSMHYSGMGAAASRRGTLRASLSLSSYFPLPLQKQIEKIIIIYQALLFYRTLGDVRLGVTARAAAVHRDEEERPRPDTSDLSQIASLITRSARTALLPAKIMAARGVSLPTTSSLRSGPSSRRGTFSALSSPLAR